MKLIFASANKHKATEIRNSLGGGFEVILPAELGFTDEIEETGATLEENAAIKARTIFEKFRQPVFADDTGLEVKGLNGAPGVFSARYAGENASFKDNCDLLLKEMDGIEDRSAAFKTVICFIDNNGVEHFFTGVVAGVITRDFRGNEGFGYDPVFLPDGSDKTFAEMSLEEKNKISHRARAVLAFSKYMNSNV